MSIEQLLLKLTCEILDCDKSSCPYEDKTKCPKQIKCMELCGLVHSDIKGDE